MWEISSFGKVMWEWECRQAHAADQALILPSDWLTPAPKLLCGALLELCNLTAHLTGGGTGCILKHTWPRSPPHADQWKFPY